MEGVAGEAMIKEEALTIGGGKRVEGICIHQQGKRKSSDAKGKGEGKISRKALYVRFVSVKLRMRDAVTTERKEDQDSIRWKRSHVRKSLD